MQINAFSAYNGDFIQHALNYCVTSYTAGEEDASPSFRQNSLLWGLSLANNRLSTFTGLKKKQRRQEKCTPSTASSLNTALPNTFASCVKHSYLDASYLDVFNAILVAVRYGLID